MVNSWSQFSWDRSLTLVIVLLIQPVYSRYSCIQKQLDHIQELYASLDSFYPLECDLISRNDGACHHFDTRLSIPMSSLRHLSSLGCYFSLLNLDHWWKYSVSCLNLDHRIGNLKWYPLIWSPIYVYDSDWRLIKGIYFSNISNSSFSPRIFRKLSNFFSA